jgi:hypothetical protein
MPGQFYLRQKGVLRIAQTYFGVAERLLGPDELFARERQRAGYELFERSGEHWECQNRYTKGNRD